MVLDCPTPEQAELAIEAILSFAQSLDGIWLSPSAGPAAQEAGKAQDAQPTQAVEQQEHTQSTGDSQAISEKDGQAYSFEDLQEP